MTTVTANTSATTRIAIRWESYFATLKRGINGVYHHVSEAHLKRYLAEFDFRYNNRAKLGVSDGERAAKALLGIGCLTKPRTHKQKAKRFVQWRKRKRRQA